MVGDVIAVPPMHAPSLHMSTAAETALLLDAVYWYGGVDVRDHPREPVVAAIAGVRAALGLPSTTALLDRVVHRPDDLRRLLQVLGDLVAPGDVNDQVGAGWRASLIPLLRSTPFPKLWVADLTDPTLLENLLLLLHHEQLLARTALFITAGDPALLRLLKDALQRSERLHALAERGDWLANLVWTEYCLLTDATFNEFEFILCGERLTLLSQSMQRRVVRLLGESVSRCGLLQMAAIEEDEAASLVPIFLPVGQGGQLYRHATLERESQRRRRG